MKTVPKLSGPINISKITEKANIYFLFGKFIASKIAIAITNFEIIIK